MGDDSLEMGRISHHAGEDGVVLAAGDQLEAATGFLTLADN